LYGEKQTKAFCSSCKDVTRHEYVLFGKSGRSTKSSLNRKFLTVLFSFLDTGYGSGDYKYTECGTYLNSSDNMD